MYFDILLQTFNITLPVMALVLLGVVLRRRGMIDDTFIAMASRLVFTLSLPVLMFMAIVTADLQVSDHLPLVGFSLVTAIGAWLVSWLVAVLAKTPQNKQGALIQAAFRSNLGIIGLALCINADLDAGPVIGALILAVVTPVYNLLSVWVLTSGQGSLNWRAQVWGVISNPLIIAIALAAVVRMLGVELPVVMHTAGSALAGMTLPLALIGIGGSLSLGGVTGFDRHVWLAVALKLVVLPALIIVAAILSGFTGASLLMLAIMFASPTAAAAFVMATAMGADGRLTANAIALSTLASAVSVTSIIYVLNLGGLV